MQAVGFAARIRWRKVNKFVIARRPQADVAISQKPVGQQAGLGEFGVWCVRLPRPLRGLAMTNLGTGAVDDATT